MTDGVTISIDEDTGNYMFLVNESTQHLINQDSVVRRASHVEPWHPVIRLLFRAIRFVSRDESRAAAWTRIWPCKWRVNLSPVGGPVVPVEWANRASAINFEVNWLNENFL